MDKCIMCMGAGVVEVGSGTGAQRCPVCGGQGSGASESKPLTPGASEHEEDLVKEMRKLGEGLAQPVKDFMLKKIPSLSGPEDLREMLALVHGALVMNLYAYWSLAKSVGMKGTFEEWADTHRHLLSRFGGERGER